MIAKEELEQMTRDVRYLMDRVAIKDCAVRHARGCDRYDAEVLTSAYHPDGFDEHGHAINPGPKYSEWVNAGHEERFQGHNHNVFQQVCEIEGDVAHCETYVIGMFRDNDGGTSRFLYGRYLDRLERRNGVWAIMVRRSPVDGMLVGHSAMLTAPAFIRQGYIKGMKDKRDLSYQRPLTLDHTPADRW
jgi:hypothetical protein